MNAMIQTANQYTNFHNKLTEMRKANNHYSAYLLEIRSLYEVSCHLIKNEPRTQFREVTAQCTYAAMRMAIPFLAQWEDELELKSMEIHRHAENSLDDETATINMIDGIYQDWVIYKEDAQNLIGIAQVAIEELNGVSVEETTNFDVGQLQALAMAAQRLSTLFLADLTSQINSVMAQRGEG